MLSMLEGLIYEETVKNSSVLDLTKYDWSFLQIFRRWYTKEEEEDLRWLAGP